MIGSTKTARYAIVGGLAVDAALAALIAVVMSEMHIFTALIAAVCTFVCVSAVSGVFLRTRNEDHDVQTIRDTNEGASPWRGRRLLSKLGIFLIGVGETFLCGIAFFAMTDYCNAHHHLSWALPFINRYFVVCLVLVGSILPVSNALLRQWLLVAGNVLGPLLALGLLAVIAAGMAGIG